MDTQDRRIPITLLTGFLGAGKTTVLNTLLWQDAFADAAVFINEFGDVGVDHLLVEKIDDEVVLLDSGCICCSMRGDLPKALRDLFQRAQRKVIPVPKRVVIETTGIADPAPVIHSLLSDHFTAERYRFDGVITVIAATHGVDQIEANTEALKQVVMADRIIISKCDLASEQPIDALTTRLQALNPGAAIALSTRGSVKASEIVGIGLYDPASKTPDVARWLAEVATLDAAAKAEAQKRLNFRSQGRRTVAQTPSVHTTSDVTSFVIEFDDAKPWAYFTTLLDTLLQGHSAQILRIKGLLNIQGEAGPRVVQCVHEVRYPIVRLDAWPETEPFADHKSRLVFITKQLSEVQLRNSIAHINELIARYGVTPQH